MFLGLIVVVARSNIMIKNKALIISLDFELLWGVRDTRGIEYHQQLINVHKVVPLLLALFEKYNIACTWATVGALSVPDENSFKKIMPSKFPTYKDINLSPYPFLGKMFELTDELLFAPDLINQIIQTPKQELASHTFCHYYCLEQGQTVEQFEADLKANRSIAELYNVNFKSLVFPRNQFNQEYLNACAESGIICYRGNPRHWAYKAESREGRSSFKRAFRLIDAYLPLSGSLRQKVKVDKKSGLFDIPASVFLRPYSVHLSFFEKLRLWRIKWSMTRTAKKSGLFHLWWHPHNFGNNILENLTFLEEILKHFKYLNEQYDFESLTMEQVARQVKK